MSFSAIATVQLASRVVQELKGQAEVELAGLPSVAFAYSIGYGPTDPHWSLALLWGRFVISSLSHPQISEVPCL